jgi:hypothetical protein
MKTIILFALLISSSFADKHEKYSRKANSKDTDKFEKYDSDFR